MKQRKKQPAVTRQMILDAALLERGNAAGWIQPEVEAGMFVANFCGLSVTSKCNPEDAFRRLCMSGLEAYHETLRPE